MYEKKKKRLISWLFAALGLILVAYPLISEYVYQHGVKSTAGAYERTAANLDEESYALEMENAVIYNERLRSAAVLMQPYGETRNRESGDYVSLLNFSGNGLMAYIDIPSIDVYLPVFHGTSEAALEKGIGHLLGSSLPVGGIGTHCVLTGHTGLSNVKLFSDLDVLQPGDLFYIHVAKETLAYRVDTIYVVLPEETDYLQIDKDKDLVTLITCTPFGINDHRLLVRGVRTDYDPEEYVSEEEKEKPQLQWMRSYRKAILVGVVICLVLAAIWRIAFLLYAYQARRGKKDSIKKRISKTASK